QRAGAVLPPRRPGTAAADVRDGRRADRARPDLGHESGRRLLNYADDHVRAASAGSAPPRVPPRCPTGDGATRWGPAARGSPARWWLPARRWSPTHWRLPARWWLPARAPTAGLRPRTGRARDAERRLRTAAEHHRTHRTGLDTGPAHQQPAGLQRGDLRR